MAVPDGIDWGVGAVTIAEGSTGQLSYSVGSGNFTAEDLTAFLDGYAVATAKTSSQITFYGVTAGTITVPSGTTIGTSATVNALTVTVTAVADKQYLNRHGLGKYTRAMRKEYQSEIANSGFTKIVKVSSLPASGIDDKAIYVVVS